MLGKWITIKDIAHATIDELDELVDRYNNYESLADDLEDTLNMYHTKKKRVEDLRKLLKHYTNKDMVKNLEKQITGLQLELGKNNLLIEAIRKSFENGDNNIWIDGTGDFMINEGHGGEDYLLTYWYEQLNRH